MAGPFDATRRASKEGLLRYAWQPSLEGRFASLLKRRANGGHPGDVTMLRRRGGLSRSALDARGKGARDRSRTTDGCVSSGGTGCAPRGASREQRDLWGCSLEAPPAVVWPPCQARRGENTGTPGDRGFDPHHPTPFLIFADLLPAPSPVVVLSYVMHVSGAMARRVGDLTSPTEARSTAAVLTLARGKGSPSSLPPLHFSTLPLTSASRITHRHPEVNP